MKPNNQNSTIPINQHEKNQNSMAFTIPSKIQNLGHPHEIQNNSLNSHNPHHFHSFLNPLLCVYYNRVGGLLNANEK
jgi:hypothetical protein